MSFYVAINYYVEVLMLFRRFEMVCKRQFSLLSMEREICRKLEPIQTATDFISLSPVSRRTIFAALTIRYKPNISFMQRRTAFRSK